MNTSSARTGGHLLIIPEDSLYLQKTGVIMAQKVSVYIPKGDMPFFRKLSRKMGWSFSESTSGEEKENTLKSIEQGFTELKCARDNNQSLPGINQIFDELKAD